MMPNAIPKPEFVSNVEAAVRDLGYPHMVSRSLVELRMVEMGFLSYHPLPKHGAYGKRTTGRKVRERISLSMKLISTPDGKKYSFRSRPQGKKCMTYVAE